MLYQLRLSMKCTLPLLVVVLVFAFSSLAQAEDWPQWLGTNRDAEWREEGIIDRFPEEGPKLRWESKLGAGYSGPAVAEGRVFVMDRLAAEVNPDKARLLHDGTPPRNINFVRKLLARQGAPSLPERSRRQTALGTRVGLSVHDCGRLCDRPPGHSHRGR